MSEPIPVETIVLHDLVNGEGQPFSPYCWRVREALLSLRLPFETDALLYTDIPARFETPGTTLPVLTVNDRPIHESWPIVNWLDAHAAQASGEDHPLFGSREGRAYAEFVGHFVDSQLNPLAFRCVVMDILERLHPDDRAYFRQTREKRLGGFKLEATRSVRDTYRDRFRKAIEPARRQVGEGGYLAGRRPGYSDMILHATFQWVRTMSDYELLEGVDPLVGWLARMDVWLETLIEEQDDG